MRNRKLFCIWKGIIFGTGKCFYTDCKKEILIANETELQKHKFCRNCGGKIITENQVKEISNEVNK